MDVQINTTRAVFGATLLLLLALLFSGLQAIAQTPYTKESAAASHAVIFAYNRINDENVDQTSLPLEQFRAHIKAIQDLGYTVRPVHDIIETIRAGKTLPDRTIGITFDRGYKSALGGAMDILIDEGIPFTVFISPQQTEAGAPQYLSWGDIVTLSREDGVDIALSSERFEQNVAEDEFKRLLNKSRILFREKLSTEPKLFSFASGEITPRNLSIIKVQGFSGAFGLQSGVIHSQSNWNALPRFMMAGDFGSLERFMTAAEALPLPATDFEPNDNTIDAESPVIGFTLADNINNASAAHLNCFVSGQGAAKIEHLGNRIEVRPAYPLEETRVRINCTAPQSSLDESGDEKIRWRWLGMMLKVKGAPEDMNNSATARTEPAVLP